MQNKNDEIRDKILRFLYRVHGAARGPKGVAIGIREIQKALKEYEIKSSEVNSNLDYLIQKDWIKKVIEQRTFTTKRGTTQQAEKITYKISYIGIDRLEGASTYKIDSSFSKINITNINGVTVIGSGNVVNSKFTDLSRFLSELERNINETKELNEEEKLNILADIGSIQNQLSKPKPNFDVIKTIWKGVEKAVTVGGFAQLVAQIGHLL